MEIVELETFIAPEPQLWEAGPSAPLLTIDFDPIPEIAFELELAIAEAVINDALNQAPRLDFVASELPDGDHEAPVLPPPLEFEGANENAAPPVAIDAPLGEEIAAAA